ncbi:hypothetical protein AAEO56_09315 [Flavobacterium sp. DGU11]|uniref:Uncharacterized protein n=1 Tax=Flavobacterium arundinis TaxID=3139143 RepID=A0ABU9HWB2_9FLAO
MFEFLKNDKVLPVFISAITTVLVFFLTLFTKNFIDTRILRSKLNTEHKFDQRKKIKEVLAKNKVHLLIACEDFNYRMWNFENNYNQNWLNVQRVDYLNTDRYYFHSFIYRFLAVFAWTKKIQKEMIYLDTTIATRDDLDFIKFLNVFQCMFCDLTFMEGLQANADGSDHFYKNTFDKYAYCLITDDGIKSYSEYIKDLSNNNELLDDLFVYFEGMSPLESRKRWDRFHLFHLSILIFLNKYGYDYQKTGSKKIKYILEHPKRSDYLPNFFNLLKDYCLDRNNKVIEIQKISGLKKGWFPF